jgi:hypothetical protein
MIAAISRSTKWAIKALSKVGIKMICHNFMAGLGWTRSEGRVFAFGYMKGIMTAVKPPSGEKKLRGASLPALSFAHPIR